MTPRPPTSRDLIAILTRLISSEGVVIIVVKKLIRQWKCDITNVTGQFNIITS